MTYDMALSFLIRGKCKSITHKSWPRSYCLTLWRYTATYYTLYHTRLDPDLPKQFHDQRAYQVSCDKRQINDTIMYIGDALDRVDRWVTEEMLADSNWNLLDVMWDNEEYQDMLDGALVAITEMKKKK